MSWVAFQFTVWRTVFSLAWQASPASAVLAVAGWFVTTVVAGPVLALALGGLAQNAKQPDVLLVALLAVALIVPETILQATDAARHYLRERCQLVVDQNTIQAHLGLETASADMDNKYQDCVFFVRANARKLADSFLIVAGALGLTLGFGVSFCALFSINPFLAIPAAVAAVLGVVQVYVSSWVAKAEENLTTSRRLLADLVDTVTDPQHRGIAATTPVASWSAGVYQQHVSHHRSVLWRTNMVASGANIGMYIVQVTVMAAMVVLAFVLGQQGIITAGQVVAVVTLNQFALESARGLVSNVSQFRRAETLGRKLHTLMTQAHTVSTTSVDGSREPGNTSHGAHTERPGAAGRVVLEDVSYGYPRQDALALADFSFTFEPGTVYAIVGSNGAGKSTLAKVLAGLLKPNQGSVSVGSARFEDVGYSAWRAGVAFTFQSFTKLPFSLKDNVLVGDLHTWPQTPDDSDHRALNLLHQVKGEGVLRAVSGDLDVQLGDDQTVHRLSAGQWQKVAAARTACKAMPFMRIVDEPTSALDPEQEHCAFVHLMNTARESQNASTVHIFVTHRYSSAKMADCILLMDKGALQVSGTHEELMACSADYRANVERFDALLAAAPPGTRRD